MTDFDPTAVLPGPPDPWDEAPTPTLRPGTTVPHDRHDRRGTGDGRPDPRPASPDPGNDAARLATAIRSTVEAGDPVVVTGCGTSEHGAQAGAEILREAAAAAGLIASAIRSEQAFELSLAPPDRGLVIGVTHEGGTVATRAALAGRP